MLRKDIKSIIWGGILIIRFLKNRYGLKDLIIKYLKKYYLLLSPDETNIKQK